ncbi:PAS domain-containing protein [uncultured Roseobacter sp.]|uniref:PAS domain-containing protein n=1 Tax=uncultured Roseobacter sp. TaxID=114847 RepID=UPI002639DF38|nr:PAS domain-containing protein [uncultured Roseobacter sp.]
MLYHPFYRDTCLDTVMSLCNEIRLPISIADPEQHDTPLIYVNAAFEEMTQYSAAEIIGHNCRFLQGALTDRVITDELAEAMLLRQSESCCLLNYRKDGTPFYNVLTIQPLQIDRDTTLLMACQFDFNPTRPHTNLSKTCSRIDEAQRQLRNRMDFGRDPVGTQESYRLDTLAMRVESTFARVRNTVVRVSQNRMLDKLSECDIGDRIGAITRRTRAVATMQ